MAMASPLSHRDITRFHHHHHSHLISLLKHYGKTKSLSSGRILHDFLLRSTCFDHDQFLQNLLVDMYGSCGSLKEAQNIFDSLLHPNVYSWNVLLHGYGKHGSLADARSVFERIPHPDVCSWNTLIKLVSQHSCLDDTKFVFGMIPYRNVVSWNAMISAAVRPKDSFDDAFQFFIQMIVEGIQPDKFTFVSVIDACTGLLNLQMGKIIHVVVISAGCEQDLLVGTALVNMYGKCGQSSLATVVFRTMPCPDDVAWTAMMASFSHNDLGKEALDVFYMMLHRGIKADVVTYVCALNACSSFGVVNEGKEIHSAVVELQLETNHVICSALVDMYGKCGSLSDARCIFGNMSYHDPVTWTIMICSYAQNHENDEALHLFYQMICKGFHPDAITFICALDACANLSKLDDGQVIHSAILEMVLENDIVISNNLVNMFGKCGCPLESKKVFERMPFKNILSWNTMIGTFALNGHCKEAFLLFDRMQIEGIKPDDVTYLSILSTCSHGGDVQNGCYVFTSMNQYYGMGYTKDHYVCVIDLLGRAGHLEEAEIFIKSIPSLSDLPMAWLCLLGASKTHGDINRGVRAGKCCVNLDPKDPAPCVALLNFYSEMGESEDIGNLQEASA